jgi:hypothetical protein
MSAQNGSLLDPADVHRNVLATLQAEKQELINQWREIERVEQFHCRRAGMDPPATVVFPGYDEASPTFVMSAAQAIRAVIGDRVSPDMTKHDAAAYALKKIGRPAKIGQIADYLASVGYGKGADRRVQFNGLYTALKRRADMFEAVGGAKWRLKERAAEEEADD